MVEISLLTELTVSLVAALLISFMATPIVKRFANAVGAIDVPRDSTRMHTRPIPRQGGLAIFLGFVLSVVIFADVNRQIQGILLGTVIVVITGAIDDIVDLKWWIKYLAQFVAAGVVVAHGVVLERFSNPVATWFGGEYIELGFLAIPVTLIWIVAITNSVNFIDGLDGLSVGVSCISSLTMLLTALIVADGNTALIMAALAGACIGFMPHNLYPAKIFMGDTGAYLLGFVLATMSILGLFKFYTVISFSVPFLILALPIFDEVFAVFRRLAKGLKPWDRDRGHLHHRLIDLGLTQKQAVAVFYTASTILGLLSIILITDGGLKAFIFGGSALLSAVIILALFKREHQKKK